MTASPAVDATPARGEEKVRLPASLPLKRDDDSDASIGRIWMKEAVLLVVLVTAAAMVLIRKRASLPVSPALYRVGRRWLSRKVSGEASHPRVESTTRLTNRASVHVVHWDGKEWLVGCTEQNMIVLGQRSSQSGSSGWPEETSLSETVSRDGSPLTAEAS